MSTEQINFVELMDSLNVVELMDSFYFFDELTYSFEENMNYIKSDMILQPDMCGDYICELQNYDIGNFCTNNLCSICLNEFTLSTEIYVISCNHLFHKKCIGEWINKKKNCPLCRKKCMKYDNDKKKFIEEPDNYNVSLNSNAVRGRFVSLDDFFNISSIEPSENELITDPGYLRDFVSNNDQIDVNSLYIN